MLFVFTNRLVLQLVSRRCLSLGVASYFELLSNELRCGGTKRKHCTNTAQAAHSTNICHMRRRLPQMPIAKHQGLGAENTSKKHKPSLTVTKPFEICEICEILR